MVLDDQQLRLRVALVLGSFFVVLWGLLWAANLFGGFSRTGAEEAGGCAVTGYVLLMWTWVLFQRHRWRQINAQRQAIAAGQGHAAWLAPPPPVRLEPTPALTMTFPLLPAWRGLLLLLGLLLLYVGVVLWTSGVPLAILGGGLVVLTLILLGVALASARSPEQFEIRPAGLVVKRPFRFPQAIRWEDADIFVRWSWGKRAGSTQVYELASSTTILRWRVLPRQQWWHLERPKESWETYYMQVETLRALVEDATGLPLYEVG